MKIVILAGGAGTRLKEIIKDIPKPMALVGGRPFLEYLILQLSKYRLNDIIISVGYKKNIIKAYFGNGQKWGVNIAYSEEDKPLGTGGAIKKALRLIDDKQFIVMNGDSFLGINFDKFIKFHKKRCASASMGLVHIEQANRFGKVKMNDKNEITEFVEKGSDNQGLMNGGIYIFNCDILMNMPDGKVSLEYDFIPTLTNKGLYGMKVKGFFVDIGIPQDYLNLCNNVGRLIRAIEPFPR